MTCERCGQQATASTMSWFCTQMICMTCSAVERQHPMFAEAVKADVEACRSGDFNYPGIGLPASLRRPPRSSRS